MSALASSSGWRFTNVGSDMGELGPAVERTREHYGPAPAELLADGGYVSLAEIDDLSAGRTTLYAPPTTRPARADGPRRRVDSPAVAE